MLQIIQSHNVLFLLLSLLVFASFAVLWKSFLHRALCERNGNPSSKRFITLLFSWVTVEVVLFAVIFDKVIADNLIVLLTTVVVGGMGLTIPALFAPKETGSKSAANANSQSQ